MRKCILAVAFLLAVTGCSKLDNQKAAPELTSESVTKPVTQSVNGSTGEAASSGEPNADLTKVRFGVLPYGDHTFAIIGVKQGWFKEVGIDLDCQPIKIEDVVPFLKNGTLDAASVPPGILYASYEMAPNLVSFTLSDLFQGFCIMGQPNENFKSYSQFVASGLTPAQAVKAAAQQLRGKTFAYPAEAAIKPFVDLCIQKSGLTRNDFKSLVLDDPMTINAMRKKQADFQVGGAPSRVILQREGYKPILGCVDLAQTAHPSPKSPELASILEDGWATTREYYNQHHDVVLRLASVNYRIMRFMHDHEGQALAIHMPYLSQVTGQPFTSADGKIIYDSLDPFYTFEQQRDWYHNKNALYFYNNVNGAILNNYIAQGIYRKTPPTVHDVLVAGDVYQELEKLKSQTENDLHKLQQSKSVASSKQAHEQYNQARKFYENYDFLDSAKLAKQLCAELKI